MPPNTQMYTIAPRNTPQHAYKPHNAHSPVTPTLTSQYLDQLMMSHTFHDARLPPQPMESHRNAQIDLAMQKFSKKCQALPHKASDITVTPRFASKLSLVL